MTGIYRISECKDEYVDHHPYPGQPIQRPYLPKIPDNLKVFWSTDKLKPKGKIFILIFIGFINKNTKLKLVLCLKSSGYLPNVTEIRENYQNLNAGRPIIYRLADTLEKVLIKIK